MIMEANVLRVIQGPCENLHRPPIHPLFRSAAAYHGRRVIGVILTGALDDGTAGLMVVRARGGEAVIQDPETTLFSSMPRSALKEVPDAHVRPLPEIPTLLLELIREELPKAPPLNQAETVTAIKETRIAELDMSEIENEDRRGRPSAFACPDCGGVLWEIDDHDFMRFRCCVGHAYTALNLGAQQSHAIETALWSAFARIGGKRLALPPHGRACLELFARERIETFTERAENINANARVLRDFLLHVNRDGEQLLETAEV